MKIQFMDIRCLLLPLVALPLFAQDFSANAARQLSSPRRVRINNLPVTLQSAHVWNNGETVTWNGIVDTPLPGSFSLAITGSLVAGYLSTASGETFEISGTPEYLIYTKVAAPVPFLCPAIPDPTPPASKSASSVPPQIGTDSELDILVVYITAAKTALSGSTGTLNTFAEPSRSPIKPSPIRTSLPRSI